MSRPRTLLHLGPNLKLPASETQTQTLVVYGGKGMGKTNLAAVLAEELAAAGLRFSWLDPVGVAWGLKHSSDGRGAGVEVLILGGIHGDLPILPTAGAVVADFVVDESVSVIVDISRRADGRMWGAGEKIRFVRDYCVRVFERQGETLRPIMQMIDEAGRFVPQQMPKGSVDIAECVGAIEQLVELGRNVGVGVTLITQRSARMNKSVSELAEMMVAFRTVGPRSIDAIVDWFGEHVPKAQWAPLVESLRALDRGTALIVSPGWLKLEGEFEVRARRTFDSSATPEAGKERKPRGKGARLPDLDAYKERMAATVEEAEGRDPRALQGRIRELEERIAEADKELGRAHDALENQQPAAAEPVEVEVPVFDDNVAQELRAILAEFQSAVRDEAGTLEAFLEQITKQIAEASRLTDSWHGKALATFDQIRLPNVSAVAAKVAELRENDLTNVEVAGGRVPDPVAPPRKDGQVTGPEQRVLDALAWWWKVGNKAPSRLQLAMVAGYHPRTKGYTNALGAMRSAGLVEYPQDGHVSATSSGLNLARIPESPTTTEHLRAMIYQQVGPNKARILQTLVEYQRRAGEPISREVLADLLGYHPRTKGYTNALGALRTLGLIEYPQPGMLAVTDAMFISGLAA